MHEVGVGREDSESPPRRHRADQKIRVRPLHAFGAAAVEERRRLFVVLRQESDVGECPQVVPQCFVLLGPGYTREQLLSHRPQHRRPSLANELGQLQRVGGGRRSPSAKRERPNRSIDHDVHGRRRCRLWSYSGSKSTFPKRSRILACFRRWTYSCSASVTVSFLVRSPPTRSASLRSPSSIARLVAMCRSLHILAPRRNRSCWERSCSSGGAGRSAVEQLGIRSAFPFLEAGITGRRRSRVSRPRG